MPVTNSGSAASSDPANPQLYNLDQDPSEKFDLAANGRVLKDCVRSRTSTSRPSCPSRIRSRRAHRPRALVVSTRRAAIAWLSAALLAVSGCNRGAPESPRQNPSTDPHAAHQKSSAGRPGPTRAEPQRHATPGLAPSGMVWIPGGESGWM